MEDNSQAQWTLIDTTIIIYFITTALSKFKEQEFLIDTQHHYRISLSMVAERRYSVQMNLGLQQLVRYYQSNTVVDACICTKHNSTNEWLSHALDIIILQLVIGRNWIKV